ncbi:MAG: hypothetical protein LBP95_00435 [Deltaproteobacteria bacterium]|nr:hypothetical protein [Deltaproteobacteria bacterium]
MPVEDRFPKAGPGGANGRGAVFCHGGHDGRHGGRAGGAGRGSLTFEKQVGLGHGQAADIGVFVARGHVLKIVKPLGNGGLGKYGRPGDENKIYGTGAAFSSAMKAPHDSANFAGLFLIVKL